MILLIDNYDSFTYNLYDYFARLGKEILVLKNDEVDANSLNNYQFDRLVLSPGPNTPSESGNLMSILESAVDKVPILGICLGHQAIGQYFGAQLVHSELPMHGKVSELLHDGKGIYLGLPQKFNVCRYHSLILKEIEHTELIQNAHTISGECMGFYHKHLPITGIQYHPEAILTEYGIDILDNWIKQTEPAVS